MVFDSLPFYSCLMMTLKGWNMQHFINADIVIKIRQIFLVT